MQFINETDKLDQHFLIDQEVISRFIKEANLKKTDTIVEVGPGKGNISSLIADKVKKLYLIELDRRLEKYLVLLSYEKGNIELIFDSVLDTYIPPCDKIVTSLPYSIVEPFIYKIIKCDFKEILMITGSRFANNVLENKTTKLSLLTNCFFKIEKIMDILPESFDPKPRVLSSMIRLTPIKENDLTDEMIIFRNLYFYDDKKIKNALVESFIRLNYLKNITLTQREAKKIVSELSINEELLAKTFNAISNEELIAIYESINSYMKNTL